MIKYLFKTLLALVCAAIILQSSPVNAVNGRPDEATINFMGINRIYYYNPNGNCIGANGYTGIASGSDNEAKIWNYFASAGINGISNNPAAIAGIMGNIATESSFNPFAVSSSGRYYGLYQTNSSSMITEINLLGDYWGTTDAPVEINDSAIEIELNYLINDKFATPEKRFNTYVNSALNNSIPDSADGAKIYAELFLVAVERAVGGSEPITSQEAKNLAANLGLSDYNDSWQGVDGRRNNAYDIYNKYASSTGTNTNVITSSSLCYGSRSPYNGDTIPQYFQCGESWSDLMFGPGGIYGTEGTTICQSGCGPTSFAMMATALLGQTILPDEVADIAGKLNMHAGNSTTGWQGSSWEITETLATYYGLQFRAINTCDIDTINRYLQDGWMIHTSGTGSAPFTTSGHYIGIAGINDGGEWYIANSAGRNNANRYYSPSSVVSAGMKCANVRAIKR